MRKGHETLAMLAKNIFNVNILDSYWFVFFSKHKKSVKILWWDKSGMALYHKKLDLGLYSWNNLNSTSDDFTVEYWQLQLILDGVEIINIKRKKRFKIKD
jgi:hypothetical protein